MTAFPPDSLARRALRELEPIRTQLRALERALVVQARRDGASWREVGEDLGISLQSAWQRHNAVDPCRRRPTEIDEVRAFHRDPAAYFDPAAPDAHAPSEAPERL